MPTAASSAVSIRRQNLKISDSVPMSFIRAPYVESVSDGVEILSVVDDHIVGVRYGNQVAIAFHPELDSDRKIHQMFLDMIS